MVSDRRFDILFEPVKIGPVTAPNRFYQVPHCTGMGYALPQTLAAMRESKAEGGWGVVCTEYCSIHPTSDDMPYPFASLWDEDDVRNMAAMADKVHAHGALAGVELWHGGIRSSNLHARETSIGPASLPAARDPVQCREMDTADIREYRAWHRAAALRAKEAGFDIVYVYAAHTYLLAQFLDPVINQRRDEYGGRLENRLRLLREVLEETKEAVGQSCAVAVRIEVDDEDGDGEEERRAMLEMIRHLPDLFDVTIADYYQEMGVSRFVKEGSIEPFIAHVRALTGKPVVSVGRFTSPETMLDQVKRGVLDLIGAARPSIADPFLPLKIREGRFEDIRECIGCNICYASDVRAVPLRCTQNPAMGEEWRRGWHSERVRPARSNDAVLVVGTGPAGLEAAHILGKRGYPVMLAEASESLGGRVTRESRLPGLAEWVRVRDYRLQQIRKLSNVELFPASPMTAADVRATGARHVLIATGSRWRADGRGRQHRSAIAGFTDPLVLTPDDIMDGKRPRQGPVVVFDDDHYYMAGVLAELLAREGHVVTYVTTAGIVSSWTVNTAEQPRVQKRLVELGVEIIVSADVIALEPAAARLTCVFSRRERLVPCGSLITVTSRDPVDRLWRELASDSVANDMAGIRTLRRIGDCNGPGLIATAVYDGHKAARELQATAAEMATRRERVTIGTYGHTNVPCRTI
jgi:dimethylamine/trimethylamine dehydrogenase